LGDLLRLLVANRFLVHPLYYHRLLFLLGTTAYQSYRKGIEDKIYKKKLAEYELSQAPLFIIGHYRSGTTLVHEMLGLDSENFVYPSVLQTWQPHTFLHTEKYILKNYGDKQFDRPMDKMKVKFDSPQEDEFALATLGALSPYMFMVFPASTDRYLKYTTMENVEENERSRWKKLFVDFLKKVSLKNPTKRVLLKSPVHTGRIKILLEIFPNAKFIHVHRNPYEVFLSTRHLFKTLFSHFNLQPVDYDHIDDTIFLHYEQIYSAFLKDQPLIKEGHIMSVSFDQFRSNMLGELERIYKTMKIDGWEKMEPIYRKACELRSKHEQNKFSNLSVEEKSLIASKWGKFFDAFGYAK
jgi:omega-hydroxy-beta-dihydromenaquinone-9 sulfotransferase